MKTTQPWQGHYINLDRSSERRSEIEAALGAQGLAYERFAAIEGGEGRILAGAIGCFRSHFELLSRVQTDAGWVHVVEDDAIFSDAFVPEMQRLLNSDLLAPFDIVFTEVTVMTTDFKTIRKLKSAFDERAIRLIDLKSSFEFAGTSSYFVRPGSYGRILAAMKRELAGGGPSVAVDQFYRREIQTGRIRAAAVFPFLTGISLKASAHSTIFDGGTTTALVDLLRWSFFLGSDPAEGLRRLSEIGAAPDDPHLELLTGIQRLLTATPER